LAARSSALAAASSPAQRRVAQKKAAQTAATSAQSTTDANNALFPRHARSEHRHCSALLQQRRCGGKRAAGAAARLSAFSRIYGRNAGCSGGGGGNGALDAYLAANPDVAQEARRVVADHEFGSPEEYARGIISITVRAKVAQLRR
jgi:hypothetical protein